VFALKDIEENSDTPPALAKVTLVKAWEKLGLTDESPDSSPKLFTTAPEADVGDPICDVNKTTVPDVGTI
jgi:hypothetical protein